MVAVAKKFEEVGVGLEGADVPAAVAAIDIEAEMGGAGAISPAKQLQEQLVAEWDGSEEKFPARYVTATVAVICLASWFGAYMFYASL